MAFISFIVLGIIVLVARRAVRDTPALRIGTLIGGIALLLAAASQVITVVPAGHVGVVNVFGNVADRTLKSGINFVNPFADIIHFSVKTQEIKEQATVPSKEGLTVTLEISILFRLNADEANRVYETIGENYADVIVVPIFRSVMRGVTAEYEAKALYTSEREVLAQKIQEELQRQLSKRGIIVEGTPLRQVDLPPKVTDAIEEKLRAEQESQRMEFVLTKETKEAERKRIEAQGIADFQKIVSEGIDANLLKWKGIEATEAMARSENAKIVVVGSGSDQLPVILSAD